MDNDQKRPDGDGEEQPQNLIAFMQSSPLAKAIAEDGLDFEIERPADDFAHDIDFGDSDES